MKSTMQWIETAATACICVGFKASTSAIIIGTTPAYPCARIMQSEPQISKSAAREMHGETAARSCKGLIYNCAS